MACIFRYTCWPLMIGFLAIVILPTIARTTLSVRSSTVSHAYSSGAPAVVAVAPPTPGRPRQRLCKCAFPPFPRDPCFTTTNRGASNPGRRGCRVVAGSHRHQEQHSGWHRGVRQRPHRPKEQHHQTALSAPKQALGRCRLPCTGTACIAHISLSQSPRHRAKSGLPADRSTPRGGASQASPPWQPLHTSPLAVSTSRMCHDCTTCTLCRVQLGQKTC